MKIVFENFRGAICAFPMLLFAASAMPGAAQIPHAGRPGAASTAAVQRQFSELTAGAASDPADAVCARAAVGSVVLDPPVVSSQNGVLEITFQYQTTVDAAGLTRYCYLYTNPSGQTEQAPTLEVNPGDRLIIHFHNDLPAPSASEVAAGQMHGMKMAAATSEADSACSATSVTSGSTNLHFHGTNVAPVCHQDEVVHTLVQPQTEFDYQVQIPANEPPGLYWYHPHPHGFSNIQVIGGASGAILVEGVQNVNPIVANLPQRVFVLRDQDLPAAEVGEAGAPATDLSINYVPVLFSTGYTPAVIQAPASQQEFWRMMNTSADTVLNLQVVVNGAAQPLRIVSVDGVPLTDTNGNPTTETVTSYAMSPASRVEFVLTTPAAGAKAQLVTQTWNNGPTGDADPGRPIANIVSGANAAAVNEDRLPAQTHAQAVTRFAAIDAATPVTQRTLYFSVNLALSPPQFYITEDGQTPTIFNMDAPPSITVNEGTVEQWTIENRSTMDHNFHIHQLHFQTLAINGVAVNDTTRRDTIIVPHWSGNASDPYPSVTLLMDFRDPNIVGTFVYHCHVLSHEDLGMMASIQVLPGITATSLSASPANTSAGTNVTLNATVAPSAGNGTPTGTVTFMNGSAKLGSGTLNSSGVATLTTTAIPVGNHSVTAVYSGDSSFAASTSPAVSVNITAAVTQTSLSAFPTVVTPGSTVTFTATVLAPAGAGTPNGTVNFLNGNAKLGSAALSGSGEATFSMVAPSAEVLSVTASYSGTSSFTASTSSVVTVTVSGSAGALQFVPSTPCRVADTRNASGPFGAPELAAGTIRDFYIPQSACGIPSNAVAYSLNVTVVPNGKLTYLTLWPSGQTEPNVSTLNSDGRIKANAAITPAGTNGGVSIYVSDATQVILDIDGYFVPAGTASALAFYPLTPCRVADTRNTAGALGGPALPAGGTRSFPVQSSSCGIPSNAKAYSLNVTAVPHSTLNYLTTWPTGQPLPNVSTLNSSTGTVAANAAIVPVGSNGNVSIFTSDATDVILDVNGYFASPSTGGLSLYTTTPCRVLDTRPSPFTGTIPIAPMRSSCAPSATPRVYVLNATVVPVGELIYLSLWPNGAALPNVSTLNAFDGAITSNMAIVPHRKYRGQCLRRRDNQPHPRSVQLFRAVRLGVRPRRGSRSKPSRRWRR